MLARNEVLQIWRPDLYFEQASLAPAGYTPAPSGVVRLAQRAAPPPPPFSLPATFTHGTPSPTPYQPLAPRASGGAKRQPDLEQATVLQLPHSTMGVRDGKGEMLTVSSGGDVFWSRQASHVVITPSRAFPLVARGGVLPRHPTGGSREEGV